jgi:acyl-CoA synthetase (AMP-forming)/AMP-acid ligase II
VTKTVEPSALSILNGGPLGPAKVTTLSAALVRAANLSGGEEITYLDDEGTPRKQSYAELLHDAACILSGMRAAGARVGEKVVLQIGTDPDLLAAFWACVLGGFVPVPVTPSPPAHSRLSAAQLLAGVWGMLGKAKVVTGQRTKPDASVAGSWLGTVDTLRVGPAATAFQPVAPDEPAALLLTSGSTGLPKAVTLTHRNIISRSVATKRVRNLSAANRTFNWMPLDHVGGLVMFHVRDVLLGCHQVHARINWVLTDPLRWLDAISEYRCDTTWAPNFAFGLVVDRAHEMADRSWDLSNLRYIMNGGEPITARVARRFLSLLAPFGLPSEAIHPGWGMSETSSGVVDCVFSLQASTDEDRFVSVGVPHPGVTLRVVDHNGEVQPAGTIGMLQVSGFPITSGYYANPEQNQQSFTADGWFKTGDLAFVAGGMLTVTGRADDVIEVDGVSYYGHEIEAAVEELAFVESSYTVVCQLLTESGAHHGLAVFFHPRSGTASDPEKSAVAELVASRFGLQATHVEPVPRDEVPKTGIGKRKRAQLLKRLGCRCCLLSNDVLRPGRRSPARNRQLHTQIWVAPPHQ